MGVGQMINILAGFGSVWLSLAGFGWVWLGLARFGSVWVGASFSIGHKIMAQIEIEQVLLKYEFDT